jgi:hypothetical protein
MSGAESLLNTVTTTLNAWSSELYDNVTNNNALLYFFKKFGKLGLYGEGNAKMGSIETRGGGKQIEEDISIGTNTNVGFVAYNETVGTDAVDVLQTAVYDWKYCYGNAVLYGAQIAMNSESKYRKHKLVESVIRNAEATMVNAIGAGLFNTSDADSIDGLPKLITDDGTATGANVVGGLSTSTYDNWKNQYVNVAANPTAAQLQLGMAELYRKCTRGKSCPDLIVTTPLLYGLFESGLTAQQRFTSPKLADAGFEALKFHGADVIFDENCPANRMYFLNTEAIVFNFHRDVMFKVGEREKLFGQEKYDWPITAMCNFSVRSRRDLGVLVVAGGASS